MDKKMTYKEREIMLLDAIGALSSKEEKSAELKRWGEIMTDLSDIYAATCKMKIDMLFDGGNPEKKKSYAGLWDKKIHKMRETNRMCRKYNVPRMFPAAAPDGDIERVDEELSAYFRDIMEYALTHDPLEDEEELRKADLKSILASLSGISTKERYDKIIDLVSKWGISYEIQENSQARNIIIFPHNMDKEHVTFTAHYDIFGDSCGANDNGSGVTMLLKLAQYLDRKGRDGIVIALLDREESGGYGCELYFSKDKNTSLMINVDTCGCGECVFVSDEAALDNPYAEIFRKCMTPEMLESDCFPYCDGRHAERMGIDVWSVSAFPGEDAEVMKGIRMTEEDKKLVREHSANLKFSKYHPPFSLSVLKYMHGGIYDDIEHINYDTMDKIYTYIKKAAEEIKNRR